MRLLAASIVTVAMTACSPEPCWPVLPSWLLVDDFDGAWTEQTEIVEADPALGVRVGDTSEVVGIVWADASEYLYAIHLTEVRDLFVVDSRLHLRRSPFPCAEADFNDPEREPNAMRIDFSTDLSAVAASEWTGLAMEPILGFVQDARDDPPLVVDRDEDGVLRSLSVRTKYIASERPAFPELTLLHTFVRTDR
jgi:hypothetical protein